MVRRGRSRRFREVDLGNVNPFGGGEAAGIRVARLFLTPGDVLKYVYDFGDWIQQLLGLEAIDQSEEGVKYPRVIAQNKSHYQECQVCVDEGRKTNATWVCYRCSGEEQRNIHLCDMYMEEHDEDHYLEETLY